MLIWVPGMDGGEGAGERELRRQSQGQRLERAAAHKKGKDFKRMKNSMQLNGRCVMRKVRKKGTTGNG
jgi:hypothetical protein